MVRFLRKFLAQGVLEIGADFEERLLVCEQQLGTLTQQARRQRLRNVRQADEDLVREAEDYLRANPPPGVAVAEPAAEGQPKYVQLAKRAKGA